MCSCPFNASDTLPFSVCGAYTKSIQSASFSGSTSGSSGSTGSKKPLSVARLEGEVAEVQAARAPGLGLQLRLRAVDVRHLGRFGGCCETIEITGQFS